LSKREKYKEQLSRFLPSGFEDMIVDLLFSSPVIFKIVNPRATKLGDFRAGIQGQKHQITVNGDLNKYAFLITTVHEFAHLITFEKFGHRVKPHGEEWKNEYRRLLVPLIDTQLLPKDIEQALMNSLVQTKASSCSDTDLSRVLKKYNLQETKQILLEDIPKNTIFVLQGKHFVKGELRRKRYICTDTQTKRQYLVHALAEVLPYTKDTEG
jgi:SprT protein